MALKMSTYLGVTLHSTMHPKHVKLMLTALHAKRSLELVKELNLVVVLNNYQKGRKPKNNRGGRSVADLSRTNEMVHLPWMYSDPSFDGLHAILSYSPIQIKPSPVHMPAYDGSTKSQTSLAQFYRNQD